MRIVYHLFPVLLIFMGLLGCNTEEAQIEKILSSPKAFVGSEQCKACHLEHYDTWKMTLHSRTLQDVTVNHDAVIADLDPGSIRSELKKLEKQLRVPVDQIYIPKIDEIKYTIGSQWKQRYIVEKQGALYIAPIQYNVADNRWVSYHENDWDTHRWMNRCGGCHATGVDLEKNTLSEPSVGCEACHGPGSLHVALPKTALFDKRLTIVNPSKLPAGIRNQICGSCHSRGHSTREENTSWAVGYTAGKALGPYFRGEPITPEEIRTASSDALIDAHHQQYQEWQQSIHATKGISCTSCHNVHQLGVPPTEFQTQASGSRQCLLCHTMYQPAYSHSLHSFGNCIGCHMPNIVKSRESGDLHIHTFRFMSPVNSQKAGGVDKLPNACSSCHHHRDTSLEMLIGFMNTAKKNMIPKPIYVHGAYELVGGPGE